MQVLSTAETIAKLHTKAISNSKRKRVPTATTTPIVLTVEKAFYGQLPIVAMPKLLSETQFTNCQNSLKPAKKLALLTQNSPLAIIEWSCDLVIEAWNPAAAELFNFFEEEAIGQRLDVLLEQRQISELEQGSWTKCDRAGVLREHGSISCRKLCRWYNTPLIVKGKRVGTLSTVVDVTHQTALSNEELRSQLQSRTQVLKHAMTRLRMAISDRDHSLAALQESETRFKDLAANVPGVLYQLSLQADNSYQVPYISAACEDIYGLSAEHIQADSKQLISLIHPDDRPSLELAMQKSAKQLTPWHSEHRIQLASGQVKWVQLASCPQPLEDGGTLWSGVLIDITARKQAERERQSAHVFLRNLVNGLADPVCVKNHQHELILLNDAFCAFVGRSREEMLGKKNQDFVSASDAKRIEQEDTHVLESGQRSVKEDYFSHSGGRTTFVQTTKTRFYASGDAPYLLSVIRDQTEQILAQKALKESEKRFKKLAVNVPGMLYQFRLSAELEPSFPFVSNSSRSLLGISPAQIQADASVLIAQIHPDDKAAFDRSVAESAQNLIDWHWQGRFIIPSGDIVWTQCASRPERLPDNSIVWDGILIDITDIKQAQFELEVSENKLRAQTKQLKSTLKKLKETQTKLIQSEKMSSLGQLVAGIAHEINNPASFIHGNVGHAQSYIQDLLKVLKLYQTHYPVPSPDIQALSQDLELDYILKDLPKLMGSLKTGTQRIRQIVLSLRNFSRLDESALKQVNIQDGLESTLMLLANRFKATATRSEISLVKAYEHIPEVECYPSQLNQALMNILVNAIDAIDAAATKRPYQIVIQTFQQGSQATVQLTNDGPPIPHNVSQQMFDPFFTTKPVGQGTGMGLAVSYQIVVGTHRGSLEYSQTADKKTVFTISIPIRQRGTGEGIEMSHQRMHV